MGGGYHEGRYCEGEILRWELGSTTVWEDTKRGEGL